MMRSLWTAASGMRANQLYVDNISNNLSNVNTNAFKKNKMEFQDLLYQNLHEPGSGIENGAKQPAGLQVGLGVRNVANQKIFNQGALTQTGNQLDIAITGKGFFQILLPSGEVAFTRDGAFKLAADGSLVTSNGYSLEPSITIPEGAREINIQKDGRVLVMLPGAADLEEIGQIELVKFVNESGLKAIGQNMYISTPASGEAEVGQPMVDVGDLNQYYIEASNVELVEEMVNMIVAQRAYEISSKAIQTSEDMLQVANGLRR